MVARDGGGGGGGGEATDASAGQQSIQTGDVLYLASEDDADTAPVGAGSSASKPVAEDASRASEAALGLVALLSAAKDDKSGGSRNASSSVDFSPTAQFAMPFATPSFMPAGPLFMHRGSMMHGGGMRGMGLGCEWTEYSALSFLLTLSVAICPVTWSTPVNARRP